MAVMKPRGGGGKPRDMSVCTLSIRNNAQGQWIAFCPSTEVADLLGNAVGVEKDENIKRLLWYSHLHEGYKIRDSREDERSRFDFPTDRIGHVTCNGASYVVLDGNDGEVPRIDSRRGRVGIMIPSHWKLRQ